MRVKLGGVAPHEAAGVEPAGGPPWLHLINHAATSCAPVPILLLLAGCSTTPPLPNEVRIPVPVPCLAELPPRPALLWDDMAGAPVYDQVRALLIDRGRLAVHVDELRAVLEGCR